MYYLKTTVCPCTDVNCGTILLLRVLILYILHGENAYEGSLNCLLRPIILYYYYICKDGPIDTQLHRRFLKFILSITNSSNSNVKFLSKHVINGSLSSTCDSLSYVSYLYNLDRYNITVSCVSQLQIPVNQAVECKAGLIQILLNIGIATLMTMILRTSLTHCQMNNSLFYCILLHSL